MKKRISIFLFLLISISSSGLGSAPFAFAGKHVPPEESAFTRENLGLGSEATSEKNNAIGLEVRKKACDEMERFIISWIEREKVTAVDVAEYKKISNDILSLIEDVESREVVELLFKRFFKVLIVEFMDIDKEGELLKFVVDYLTPEEIAEVKRKFDMKSLSDTEREKAEEKEVCREKTWIPERNVVLLRSSSIVFEKETEFIKIMECFLQRGDHISYEEKFNLLYEVCRYLIIDDSSKDFLEIFKNFYEKFLG